MTRDKALQQFFERFGLPAYPANAVPEDEKGRNPFPRLTYELNWGDFGDGDIPVTVNLWNYTESEAMPNLQAELVGKTLGRAGLLIRCDEGAIWIKRGSPFCQSINDPTDKMIKRRYINLLLEYITYKE